MMWEVFSYGERPYWGMSNRDVSFNFLKLLKCKTIIKSVENVDHVLQFYRYLVYFAVFLYIHKIISDSKTSFTINGE